MRQRRRDVLGRGGLLAGIMACGTAWPVSQALAGTGDAAFDADSLARALDAMGVAPVRDERVEMTVASLNENGAVVPVSVTSRVPDTREIAIVAESNPSPLAVRFTIPEGTEAFVSMRVKMAESCRIYAVVRAADRSFFAYRDTVVMVGGCG